MVTRRDVPLGVLDGPTVRSDGPEQMVFAECQTKATARPEPRRVVKLGRNQPFFPDCNTSRAFWRVWSPLSGVSWN